MTAIIKCTYDINVTVLDSDKIYQIAPTDDDGDVSPEMQLELDALDNAGCFEVSLWTRGLLKQQCPEIYAELEKLGVVLKDTIIITNLDLQNPETSRF